jgi:hypothetical protein
MGSCMSCSGSSFSPSSVETIESSLDTGDLVWLAGTDTSLEPNNPCVCKRCCRVPYVHECDDSLIACHGTACTCCLRSAHERCPSGKGTPKFMFKAGTWRMFSRVGVLVRRSLLIPESTFISAALTLLTLRFGLGPALRVFSCVCRKHACRSPRR